jgi:hypothetical protein
MMATFGGLGVLNALTSTITTTYTTVGTYARSFQQGYAQGSLQAQLDANSTGDYNNPYSSVQQTVGGWGVLGGLAGLTYSLGAMGAGAGLIRSRGNIAEIIACLGVITGCAVGNYFIAEIEGSGANVSGFGRGYDDSWAYYCQEVPGHGCPDQPDTRGSNNFSFQSGWYDLLIQKQTKLIYSAVMTGTAVLCGAVLELPNTLREYRERARNATGDEKQGDGTLEPHDEKIAALIATTSTPLLNGALHGSRDNRDAQQYAQGGRTFWSSRFLSSHSPLSDTNQGQASDDAEQEEACISNTTSQLPSPPSL